MHSTKGQAWISVELFSRVKHTSLLHEIVNYGQKRFIAFGGQKISTEMEQRLKA
jgi:hypothetical protein